MQGYNPYVNCFLCKHAHHLLYIKDGPCATCVSYHNFEPLSEKFFDRQKKQLQYYKKYEQNRK